MTQLRRMMLEEPRRRNFSDNTSRQYLLAVRQFTEHLGKPPDQLGPDELRTYQAYLLRDRKLAVGTVVGRVAALFSSAPLTIQDVKGFNDALGLTSIQRKSHPHARTGRSDRHSGNNRAASRSLPALWAEEIDLDRRGR